MSHGRLPTVIVSDVVRAARQGDVHGGVYLVDLDAGRFEQRLNWREMEIDWSGRGGGRGLRGIAFHGDRIYLAASNEILVYDRAFQPAGVIGHPLLGHCHEICVHAGRLYITSTEFDSILVYDLAAGRFSAGYCLRAPVNFLLSSVFSGRWRLHPRRLGPFVRFRRFDPGGRDGPPRGDTLHLNNVIADRGRLYVAGRILRRVLRLDDDRVAPFARIPFGTHNARPFGDGALMNHTRGDRILHTDRRGRVREAFAIPRYPEETLTHTDLPANVARQGFGRGLAVTGDGLVVAGSSPSTLSAYRFGRAEPVASVNLTRDVRNAPHGMELWPWDGAAG